MRAVKHTSAIASAAVTVLVLATTGLTAKDLPTEAASTQPARFTMSPVDGGGFVRLDTQTGQMSLCNRRDQQWMCTDMADQGRGLAEEIERLRTENKQLKSEIRKIEDIMMGDAKKPGSPDADRRAEGKFGLPSEQDVDQAIGYMERMFKKFREKLKEYDTDGKGTPL